MKKVYKVSVAKNNEKILNLKVTDSLKEALIFENMIKRDYFQKEKETTVFISQFFITNSQYLKYNHFLEKCKN